jgi:hypothetical protein
MSDGGMADPDYRIDLVLSSSGTRISIHDTDTVVLGRGA